MRTRSGQVALYLLLTLVAITFLVMMNVGAYLAVTAKNRTMNAGDAAALAVAKWQGELLNRIGAGNVDHLRAALANDDARCKEIVELQRRTCFLEPLEGIRIGNAAAKENGAERSDEMLDLLKAHVIDIRSAYQRSPELYPEPWEGAWEEYAVRFELAIGEGIWAAPDNIDFIDAAGEHILFNHQFYNAVAGRNWCWFHYNAPDLLDLYTDYHDWAPLPCADLDLRRERACNSEIYSLHLGVRTGSAVGLFGTNVIMRLTGCTAEELEASVLIRDPQQTWFVYDDELWRKWWEIDPRGEWLFPVVGGVKAEFDVRGCAAICRTQKEIPNLVTDRANRMSVWSGAAKPFGLVDGIEGSIARLDGKVECDRRVTAYGRLVTPAFEAVRLVPWDSVGGRDLCRPDLALIEHVRRHLPPYVAKGIIALHPGCEFCELIRRWEVEVFRYEGRTWLKRHSKECRRPTGGGPMHGGSPHAH